MTLEGLSRQIAAEADEKVKGILSVATKEAEAFLEQAEAEYSREASAIVEKAEVDAEAYLNESVAAAQQRNQKTMLHTRKAQMDATEKAVREAVSKGGLKGRLALLRKLLNEAKSATSDVMVLCPVNIDRATLEKESEGFEFGEDVDGIGGFILEVEDGSYSLDYRFDSRLEELLKAIRPELTELLFLEE